MPVRVRTPGLSTVRLFFSAPSSFFFLNHSTRRNSATRGLDAMAAAPRFKSHHTHTPSAHSYPNHHIMQHTHKNITPSSTSTSDPLPYALVVTHSNHIGLGNGDNCREENPFVRSHPGATYVATVSQPTFAFVQYEASLRRTQAKLWDGEYVYDFSSPFRRSETPTRNCRMAKNEYTILDGLAVTTTRPAGTT